MPSDVMFICENPSLSGLKQAAAHPIGGSVPCIEDQWAGNRKGNTFKRFRSALYQLGLKTTEPSQPGGWLCYVTNVIKEAAVAGEFNARNKETIAVYWADILRWEMTQVSPTKVFVVGNSAARLVRVLQDKRLIPIVPTYDVIHYSARTYDAVVQSRMVTEIGVGLAHAPA